MFAVRDGEDADGCTGLADFTLCREAPVRFLPSAPGPGSLHLTVFVGASHSGVDAVGVRSRHSVGWCLQW